MTITTAQYLMGQNKLDPAKVEEYLQGLVADAGATEVAPGVDLSELLDRLKKFTHNDDTHHSGETILEHIQWVVEDVHKVHDPSASPCAIVEVLNFAALLHDLGKAYTYELIDGKHTFRKHGEVSVKIAEVLLGSIQGQTSFGEQVIDVVRYHDVFMKLIDGRKHSKGQTKYLNKFMRTGLYQTNLQDLIEFSQIDGCRAKRMEETHEGMHGVLKDMRTVERNRREEAEKKQRRLAPPPEVVAAAKALLEQEEPALVDLLPDIKSIKRVLGGAGKFELIRRIEELA